MKHKKGRLIIRNLSFKINEDILKNEFLKFGNVIDVRIPKKPDGKMFGFGFVEFEKTHSAIHAINALNAKEILGRPVAVDFSIAKDRYQKLCREKLLQNSNSLIKKTDDNLSIHETEITEKENKNIKHKKNIVHKRKKSSSSEEDGSGSDEDGESENSDDETESETSEEESEEEDDNSDDDDDDCDELKDEKSEEPLRKKIKKEQMPNDEKTLFITNMSFDSTADDLKELMEKFGQVKYCLLCIDKLTEHPKGTAFVQFTEKEAAIACLEECKNQKSNIVLDGRKLNIMLAVSREEVEKMKEDRLKKGKDNRNLKLVSEGLIRPGSTAAKGVSQTDLVKRLQLENRKKRLLKLLHYFISPVRLCIHNLPLHVDDRKLRQIFAEAAGPQAKITEARIMRNLKQLDSKGIGLSKGYGFVCYTKHEDALEALRKLNNNPNVFAPNKRPIVEFSLENRQVLNARKKHMERQRGRNRQHKVEGYTANKQIFNENKKQTKRLKMKDTPKHNNKSGKEKSQITRGDKNQMSKMKSVKRSKQKFTKNQQKSNLFGKNSMKNQQKSSSFRKNSRRRAKSKQFNQSFQNKSAKN